jgi:hypothetical protein
VSKFFKNVNHTRPRSQRRPTLSGQAVVKWSYIMLRSQNCSQMSRREVEVENIEFSICKASRSCLNVTLTLRAQYVSFANPFPDV